MNHNDAFHRCIRSFLIRSFPLATVGVALAAWVGAPLSAQVFFDREDIFVLTGWLPGEPVSEDVTGQQTYKDPAWRAKMLRQFPSADADGDGALTEVEAIRFHMGRVRKFVPQGRELELLQPSVSRWTARVPMRDGETLPSEIYLPPGKGPWPVVLLRSSRGRIDSALDYTIELIDRNYAVVGQDLTPMGDFVNADVLGREVEGSEMSREQRASFNARRSERDAGEDGADTIAWLAEQPWCDGNIAVSGYSEGSSQSKRAMAQDPPELDLVVSAIGTLSRGSRGPIGMPRGGRISWDGTAPEFPTSWDPVPERSRWSSTDGVVRNAEKLDMHINDRTGWFDFAVQGAIDEWVALKDHGKATLIMGIGGHGPLSTDARMAPAYGDCDILFPEIEAFQILRGRNIPSRSRMFYFLMGDATNPKAPGNVWKVTETWPVAHEEQSWYFHPDGSLRRMRRPESSNGVGYTYDPDDPIVIASGNRMPANRHGPLDHSVLKDRDDIARFESEPLQRPLEITGEAYVDLYFSTDAEDTAFVVTVVDIYPDGYEWPIRDTAIMARYHAGMENPRPLREGEVYHARLPLVATALVVDAGHRLGVRVSSSSFPSYAIHPNRWEAIESYDEAVVARQTVHTGGEHASRVVLPVVAPGTSVDYDPAADY